MFVAQIIKSLPFMKNAYSNRRYSTFFGGKCTFPRRVSCWSYGFVGARVGGRSSLVPANEETFFTGEKPDIFFHNDMKVIKSLNIKIPWKLSLKVFKP
jgi:hypothetical protein